MTKINHLRDLVNQISDILPEHFSTFKQDFEDKCQTILNKTFNKLDLVTREEFDIQTKVLARTRKKIEELEKKLKQYETKSTKRDK